MNREKLLSRIFPKTRSSYTPKDTMLYGLGVGACINPLDIRDLRFVFEGQLQALPSMSCLLANPGDWLRAPELELDYMKLLHAEEHFSLEQSLPASGEVVGNSRFTGIVDKGAQSGALVYLERTLRTTDGALIGTARSTCFFRGDGGCGHWGVPGEELPLIPSVAPSGAVDVPTLAIAALIYRLSGDYNPLHADPAVARKAGFEKPVLHGLCTYGVACQSLVRALCDHDATRLRAMGARFTKPVYPGETIRTEYWMGADGWAQFRCLSVERNEVVLDRGKARIASYE